MSDNSKNPSLEFVVSAPGKLILFGEHSVVYGKSALAASINKRTFLKLSENSFKYQDSVVIRMKEIQFDCTLSYKDLMSMIYQNIPQFENRSETSIDDPKIINHDAFTSVIEGYIKKYAGNNLNSKQYSSLLVVLYIILGVFYDKNNANRENKNMILPLTIDITSELTVGAGTGSSASFCVCIAAAFLHYKNLKNYGYSAAQNMSFTLQGLNLISKWAFCGEKILHGKPSGIDNTVATFGSFVEVHSNKETGDKSFSCLPNPPKINVLLCNSGILRNTSKMVEKAANLKSLQSIVVDHILTAMNEVAAKASEFIKNMVRSELDGSDPPDFNNLEVLVDINHGLLYSLGVSHECLQKICLICSQHGLHAKLTGAGGGGYAFTMIPPGFDEGQLSKCIDNLQSNNFAVFKTQLGSEGVRLEK